MYINAAQSIVYLIVPSGSIVLTRSLHRAGTTKTDGPRGDRKRWFPLGDWKREAESMWIFAVQQPQELGEQYRRRQDSGRLKNKINQETIVISCAAMCTCDMSMGCPAVFFPAVAITCGHACGHACSSLAFLYGPKMVTNPCCRQTIHTSYPFDDVTHNHYGSFRLGVG